MKICLVAPHLKLPVTGYGGTERVFQALWEGLTEKGHEVSCLIYPGSNFEGGVQEIPENTELVHYFERAFKNNLKCPWVYTQHGNAQKDESLPLNTVFISKNHAERHGGKVFVHNGLNPDHFTVRPMGGDLCFLAKTSWKVKNVRGAMKIAKLSRKKLHVMGGWRFSLSRQIHWCGHVTDFKKRDIFSQCQGLVNPVRWHEPFGLNMIEAMMSGLPVYGTPYGSLPEIVGEGCGVLSDSSRELAEAILESEWDQNYIRAYSAEKFNHRQMTKNYLHVYESVLNGATLHEISPKGQAHPEELLAFQ